MRKPKLMNENVETRKFGAHYLLGASLAWMARLAQTADLGEVRKVLRDVEMIALASGSIGEKCRRQLIGHLSRIITEREVSKERPA